MNRLFTLIVLLILACVSRVSAAPYCTPFNGSMFASSGGVNVVTTLSIPFSSLINTTTNTNSFGYYEFSFTTAPVFHINSTYTINATVANAGEVAVWIDYNRDSIFQGSEKTDLVISGTSAIGTVTIPSTALLGNTRLRIMAAEKPNGLLGPCGNMTKGEGEDYTINIIAATTCVAPAGLATVGTPLSTYNKLKWTGPSGASFQYAYTTTKGFPTTGIVSSVADSAELTGLTGGTKYYFYVRSICGATDFSDWTLDSFTTAACFPPTISVSNIGDDQAHASWSMGGGALSVEYIVNSFVAEPTTAGTVTTSTSTHISGLKPNKNYCIHIRSVCAGGEYSPWVKFCFTTTAVSVDMISENIASYYPNPVKDMLNVTLKNDAVLKVMDVSGRELIRMPSEGKQATVDMSQLADGVYFLQCTNAQQSTTVRIVKTKE